MAISCRFYVERQYNDTYVVKTAVAQIDPFHSSTIRGKFATLCFFWDWLMGRSDRDPDPSKENALIEMAMGGTPSLPYVPYTNAVERPDPDPLKENTSFALRNTLKSTMIGADIEPQDPMDYPATVAALTALRDEIDAKIQEMGGAV